ncbi:M48 family metallopeptidase [Trinickia violacea]
MSATASSALRRMAALLCAGTLLANLPVAAIAQTASSTPVSPSLATPTPPMPVLPAPAKIPASAPPAAPPSAPATASDAAIYQQNRSLQVRFGNATTFRNLIPSPVLDEQASEEYADILHGAEQTGRLLPDSDPRVKLARDIAAKVTPYAAKWNDRVKTWKWEVNVVRSTEIRMYCLPGGKIVVYSGLLDRVHLNEDELGVLFGHEIAHALREHARERLGEQQSGQLGTGTIPQLFGLADLGATPLGIGSQLLAMRYTPTDETEADVIGSDTAARAGFDPRAAITLWDKLAAATHANKEQGFIYVHPYSAERRHDIMKRLPDMLVLYAKAKGVPVDSLPDYAGIAAVKQRASRE